LTATLQLRPSSDSPKRHAGNPDASPSEDPSRSWWSFDRSSSAEDLPVTAFSTAHQARSIAFDVLCRSHPNGPGLTPSPGHAARPHLHRGFVKSNGIAGNQDAFPRRVPPPSRQLAPAEAFTSGSCRAQLAPCPTGAARSSAACHRDHGVSTGGPASGVLSPPEHQAGWPGPSGFLGELAARCEWNARTGRRSSTSATRTAREHNHGTARPPARASDKARPACAELGGNLRKGLGPLPPLRPPTPGDTRVCSPLGTLRLLTALPPDASRGLTGQGPAGSRRPAPRAIPLESR
jgi:hypothetical protein